MARFYERILGGIFGQFMSKDIGIDLGTCNTLVYVKGEGITISEPSVVAVYKGSNRILMDGKAVGNTAKEMLGKTPMKIETIRPLRDGAISDFDAAEAMIRYFIRRSHNDVTGATPRVVISVPSKITKVERWTVTNSAERAGARKVHIVDEPIAAGIGAGFPMDEPIGNMIVDIGGGTTEFAVLSLRDMVVSRSIRVAGDEMDEAIIQYMKKAYNLRIGELTAERIKLTLGSAAPLEREMSMEVSGSDLTAFMPRRVGISSEEIREALGETIAAIVRGIRETLADTPPELAADLVERGITLCGGGSLLRGIDKAIQKEIGIPVRIADDPITCVARGVGVIVENLEKYAEELESAEHI